MGRREDLEASIRQSGTLIREYEALLRESSDPNEKARARRAIGEHTPILTSYLAEYGRLCQVCGYAVPQDIAEAAAIQGVDLHQLVTAEGRQAVLTTISPQDRLVLLPTGTIPDPAPPLPCSRMPYRRNDLFVGRAPDLLKLAEALKGGETIAIGQVAVATGLGGIGKTQFASEFVHRYGQFFAGGVFWLSFADASTVPSEVTSCGGAGHLNLHRQFSDLKLDDQVALVRAAWREDIPRLLIFDNCEEGKLLTEWRPTIGGCRVLVTSRCAVWDSSLGVQPLPLGVLAREESIALLRNHRADMSAEDAGAIAAELSDRGLSWGNAILRTRPHHP